MNLGGMDNGKLKVVGMWLGMIVVWYGLLACVTGCAPSGLTRSKAEHLISNNAQFAADASDLYLAVKDTTGTAGVRAGLWTVTAEDLYFHLTAKGEQYFDWSDPQRARLRSAWKRKITQVTGITEGANGSKEVEFLYEAENIPKEVAELLKLGPWKGRALLRRFDDGWRVSDLDLLTKVPERR